MLNDSQRDLIKATIPVLQEHGEALTTYFYNRMLTQHPELKEVFNLGHQRSGAQSKALAGAVLAYAQHIDNPAVLANAIQMITQKHVSLNIQAKDYAIVGDNLLASISEVLNVPMESDLIAAWAAAYGQLADILIGIEKNLYDEQAAKQGGWLGWRTFSVVKKEIESSEITSFYLQPTDGGTLPDYAVGQYISLRVTVPELGIKQPRQYTLSDAPNPLQFRISVKREDAKEQLQAGWVSNTLHHHIQEGDLVELTAPTGGFTLKNAQTTNVMISGGVGLTPMLAMLNHLSALDMPAPVHFLHACRSSNVHAMKHHLQQLKAQHANLKTYISYEQVNHDEQHGHDYDQQGYLDLAQLSADWLPTHADYYLCGPKAFMQAQYQALRQHGIAAEQIHHETFSTGDLVLQN